MQKYLTRGKSTFNLFPPIFFPGSTIGVIRVEYVYHLLETELRTVLYPNSVFGDISGADFSPKSSSNEFE